MLRSLAIICLMALCIGTALGLPTKINTVLLESGIAAYEGYGNSSPDSLRAAGVDMATALRGVTPDALGCTHIVDTSPSVHVLGQCLEAVRRNGTVLQVGLKPVGAKLELDLLPHMVNGRRLVGVLEGDRDPAEALPELVSWIKDGSLPVQSFLEHFLARDFEVARAKMVNGEVIKGVLVWD